MTTQENPSPSRLVSNPRLWLAGLMGFAGGLPILLTITVLQAWLMAESIDLTTIGILGLIALPYNLKFIWAPFLDRFNPLGMGRRRSWLITTQVCLAASIAILGTRQPLLSMWSVTLAAFLVTFFSASQDIVIDAYRRETLSDEQQGIGASMYVYGYRFGTLLASTGGLILADVVGFNGVYLFMSAIMLSMVVVTILAPEPFLSVEQPNTLRAAFAGPFFEFFRRYEKKRKAVLLLVFVFIYNAGIHLSGHMAIPFYLATGFSNTEIGAVSAIFGVGPFLLGVFAGGWFQLKTGLYKTLIGASVLKGLAIAGYVLLAFAGHSILWLSVTMAFQNLALGVGTSALMAFIANLTDPRFTATQFALFTALAALPRATLTVPTGWMATEMGWASFFVFSALLAVPGLLLLLAFKDVFRDRKAVAANT
jgi:PAT family beta-lactamase induction signal transducer AmpG